MSYRTLPDPHVIEYEWQMYSGRRFVRLNTPARILQHGDLVSSWYCNENWIPDYMAKHSLFEHTPERVAMWADLLLRPNE